MRAGLELWARRAGSRLRIVDDRSDPSRSAEAHAAPPCGGLLLRRSARTGATRRAPSPGRAHPWSGTTARPRTTSSDCRAWYRCRRRRAGISSRSGGRSPSSDRRPPSPSSPRPAVSPASRSTASCVRPVRSGSSSSRPPRRPTPLLACGPVAWEVDALAGLVAPGSSSAASPPGWPASPRWPARPGGHARARAVAPRAGRARGSRGLRRGAGLRGGLIAERCLALDPDDPVRAARGLRTATFFGSFELDDTGLQVGHRLSVVRWRGGHRELLLPRRCLSGAGGLAPLDSPRYLDDARGGSVDSCDADVLLPTSRPTRRSRLSATAPT